MNDYPLITIVTVSYNAASTIERTILSVVHQTYSDVQYIVIDGGSTDGTIDIVKKYSNRISYWVSEPDDGIYDAMNKSISFVKGDWILFLGADDMLHSESMIELVSQYFTNKTAIYYGNVLFQPSKLLYGGVYDQLTIIKKNICHQAIFYPKSVFDKYHYDTKYKIYADYNLNIICFGDSSFTFQYIDFVIAEFYELGASGTFKDEAFKKDFRKIISRNIGLIYGLYASLRLFVYKISLKFGM